MGRRAPRKISIETASRDGCTVLRIHCVTERATPRQVSHATNVCGHTAEMDVSDAIRLFGAATSLSELPVRCKICGGRDYDARMAPPAHPGAPRF